MAIASTITTSTVVDTVNWTAIIAPSDSDYVIISNEEGGAVLTRTNPADPNSEVTLPANSSKIFSAPVSRRVNRCRFPSGSPVLYIRSASGTGPIVSEFILY